MLSFVYILYLGNPAWDTPNAVTGYYSVLAFLSVSITACVINRIRTDPSPAHYVFLGGIGYTSIIFAVAAVFYIYFSEYPVAHASSSGIFLNLVAFATTGLTMMTYSHLNKTKPDENSRWYSRYVASLIIVLGVSVFCISLVISRLPLEQIIFIGMGYIVGGISFLSYSIATFWTIKQKGSWATNAPKPLAVSFGLLATSSFIHMLILPSPSILWIVSLSFMAVAFIYAIFAIGYPFFVYLGIPRKTSFSIGFIISALVVVPFLIAYVVDAWVPSATFPDHGATIVLHIITAVLSGSTAFALYKRNVSETISYQISVIYLLIFWGSAEVFIVISRMVQPVGSSIESLVPYIIGSIISAAFLTDGARRTLKPPEKKRDLISLRLYIVSIVGFLLIVLFGETISSYVEGLFPFVFNQSLAITIMLFFSFGALFALLNLFMVLTGSSGGKLSFDAISAGLPTLWIVVMILKANFAEWTAGWWAAEIIMLLAGICFPLILLSMYLKDTKEMKNLKARSILISRVLSSDITTHHEAAIDALDTLCQDSDASESGLETIAHALTDISYANELAGRFEVLISGERFPEKDLETVDIVDSINLAIKSMTSVVPDLQGLVKIDKQTGDCRVRANSLLVYVFYSIFIGIIKRIGTIQSIKVEIDRASEGFQFLWNTQITINVIVDDAEEKRDLFLRYTLDEYTDAVEFAYALRLVNLFEGELSSEASISEENLIVSFAIQIPTFTSS